MSRRKFASAAIVMTGMLAVLAAWGFWSLAHLHDANGRPLTYVDVRSTTALLVMFGAFLYSFVLAFGAAILAAPLLSSDLESGLLLPVLARPLSRAGIVVAKAVALTLAIGAFSAASAAVQLLAVWATTGYVPPHPFAAIGSLWMLATVVLAFALALSVRLPALAASLVAVTAFGIAWIVGIVSAFGIAYHNATLVRIGVISQLLLPTDAMWRVAVYQLEPAAMLGRNGSFGPMGPFSVASPPPAAVVWWTFGWIVVTMAVAAASFARRDA
ncbi:MAG TPA: ABC transporter permease [Candidatus Tumulicola sp.]